MSASSEKPSPLAHVHAGRAQIHSAARLRALTDLVLGLCRLHCSREARWIDQARIVVSHARTQTTVDRTTRRHGGHAAAQFGTTTKVKWSTAVRWLDIVDVVEILHLDIVAYRESAECRMRMVGLNAILVHHDISAMLELGSPAKEIACRSASQRGQQ